MESMEQIIVKYTKRKKQAQGFGWLLGTVALVLFITGVVGVNADYLLSSAAIGCFSILMHEVAVYCNGKAKDYNNKLEQLKQTEIGNFIRHK